MGELGEDMPEVLQPIVLIGMMGSGKTAVGTALAERLNVPFRDTDEAIVQASRMSIAEIFERDGEAFFRDRETEVLQRLLSEGPGVISTGGGVFMRAENRDLIDASGISVWLRADEALLWSRVKHKTTRPLLLTDNPRRTLGELLKARTPHYRKARLAVDANPAYSIDDMVQRVIETLDDAGLLTERT